MTRHAVVLALASTLSFPAAAQKSADNLTETQRHGRALLAQNCGVCHLPVSRGAKTYGPPLTKAAAAGSDELARAFILNGGGRMPGFKYYLKPAEVDALVAYIRTIPEQKGD